MPYRKAADSPEVPVYKIDITSSLRDTASEAGERITERLNLNEKLWAEKREERKLNEAPKREKRALKFFKRKLKNIRKTAEKGEFSVTYKLRWGLWVIKSEIASIFKEHNFTVSMDSNSITISWKTDVIAEKEDKIKKEAKEKERLKTFTFNENIRSQQLYRRKAKWTKARDGLTRDYKNPEKIDSKERYGL